MPGIICVLRKNELVKEPQFLSEKINKNLVFSDSFKTNRIHKKYLSMIITGHKNSIIRVIDSDKYIIGFVGENTTLSVDFATKLNTELDKKYNPIDIIKNIPMCSSLLIFNKKTKIFYQATDFVATKPVYFTETKDYFITCPEIFSLAVINSEQWKPSIDRTAIAMSLLNGNGNLTNNRTFLNNVKKLSGAEYIKYSNNVEIYEYDKLSYNDSNKSYNRSILDLKKAIIRDLSTINNKNTELLLSGGIDSRILLCCALIKKLSFTASTFSTIYREKVRSNSEVVIAKKICNFLKIKHTTLSGNYKNFEIEMDFAIKATGGEANMVPAALINPFAHSKELSKYDCLLFGDQLWTWSRGEKNIRNILQTILMPLFEDSDIVRCLEFNIKAKEEVINNLNYEYIKLGEKYLDPDSWEKTKDIIFWKLRESTLISTYRYQYCTINSTIPPLLFSNTINALECTNDILRRDRQIAYKLLKIIEPDNLKDIPFANTKDDYQYHWLIMNPDTKHLIGNSLKEHLSPYIEYFISKDNLENFVESLFIEASSYDISKFNKKERKGFSQNLFRLLRFAYQPIKKVSFLDKMFRKVFLKKPTQANISYYGKLVILTRLFSLNETLNKYQKEFEVDDG